MVIRFIFLLVFSLKIKIDKINLTGGGRFLVLAAKREINDKRLFGVQF